jgi:hypothetical protein
MLSMLISGRVGMGEGVAVGVGVDDGSARVALGVCWSVAVGGWVGAGVGEAVAVQAARTNINKMGRSV